MNKSWLGILALAFLPCFGLLGIVVALSGGGDDGLLPISLALFVFGIAIPIFIFHRAIKESWMKHKIKIILIAVIIAVIVIVICIITSPSSALKRALEKEGLSVSSVSYTPYYLGGYSNYKVQIKTENFSNLTEQEMFDVFDLIQGVSQDKNKSTLKDYITIISDGHKYTFDSDVFNTNGVNHFNILCDGEIMANRTTTDSTYDNHIDIDIEPYGNCTICGKKATERFQNSNYCTEHYNNAIRWAIDNVAEND